MQIKLNQLNWYRTQHRCTEK